MTDFEAAWLAARTFPGPFTREEFAIVAWRMFPDRFGLAGYHLQFPNTARIWAKMHPLVDYGCLQGSGDLTKPYQVVRHRKQWRGMRRDAFDRQRTGMNVAGERVRTDR